MTNECERETRPGVASIVASLEERPSANEEKSDMKILTDWGILLGAALFATAVMVLFI